MVTETLSLESLKELYRRALLDPDIKPLEYGLKKAGYNASRTIDFVRRFARGGYSDALWSPLASAATPGKPSDARASSLARCLLLPAALKAMERVPELPVSDFVKRCFWEEFRFIVQPAKQWREQFRPTGFPFRAMCKIVLLERVPAGQLHWEVSGFPRSWLLKVPTRDLPRVFLFLAKKMRGLGPYFVTHFPLRTPVLMRRATWKSWHAVAETLLLQPEIKGLMGASWMADPGLARVSPHLSWVVDDKVAAHALVTTIGRAKPREGFLEGSPHRTALYTSGQWSPRIGLTLWARDDIIAWAKAHNELSGPARPRPSEPTAL